MFQHPRAASSPDPFRHDDVFYSHRHAGQQPPTTAGRDGSIHTRRRSQRPFRTQQQVSVRLRVFRFGEIQSGPRQFHSTELFAFQTRLDGGNGQPGNSLPLHRSITSGTLK